MKIKLFENFSKIPNYNGNYFTKENFPLKCKYQNKEYFITLIDFEKKIVELSEGYGIERLYPIKIADITFIPENIFD